MGVYVAGPQGQYHSPPLRRAGQYRGQENQRRYHQVPGLDQTIVQSTPTLPGSDTRKKTPTIQSFHLDKWGTKAQRKRG